MKTFYEMMQILESTEAPRLPPIPSGMSRLTHFTGADPSEIEASGLRVTTMLLSTTDPHSTNEQVIQTIKDGSVGAFNRSRFGNYVILIDMPDAYVRILSAAANQIDAIPASQILGHVDRNDMSFHPNSKYSPTSMERPKVNNVLDRRIGMGDDDSSGGRVEVPAPGNHANVAEVW
jgi:hypothetical protein